MNDQRPPVRLNAGGVPEHFNFAWHHPESRATWAARGVEVVWHDYPGGTGAMVEALAEGVLDLAPVLTEGAVAAAARGAPLKVVAPWVQSALVWGVHVAAGHPAQSVADLRCATFAISRRGSGSHLMAEVMAHERGWPALRYVRVGGLDGARRALDAGEAEAFLWEKFTTKWLVDRGEWRRVGTVPTPWPGFVIVASDTALADHGAAIEAVLAGLARTLESITDASAQAFVAERYGLAPEDVAAWHAQTRWQGPEQDPAPALAPALDALVRAGVLSRPVDPRTLCRRAAPES